jgi:hypothetical protein
MTTGWQHSAIFGKRLFARCSHARRRVEKYECKKYLLCQYYKTVIRVNFIVKHCYVILVTPIHGLRGSFPSWNARGCVLDERGFCQKVIQADYFIESVGINVHLHYTDTVYATNFPLIQNSLQELSVRHMRDGIALDSWRTYYNELNLLGQSGIKGIFIASPTHTAMLPITRKNALIFPRYQTVRARSGRIRIS